MLKKHIKQLFLFIFVGLMATACDEENTESDSIPDGLVILFPSEYVSGIATIQAENHAHEEEASEDEHPEIPEDGGFELKEEGQEVYTYRQLGLETEGLISINSGETKVFSVHFIGSDGEELHEEGESETDGSDEEEHEMAIVIKGDSAGSTSFQIQLMHDGHSDYASLLINVTVLE